MSNGFVENKVREIVAEQLGLSPDDVGAQASFSHDLGADTLDFIELVMAIEEEFELEIDDDTAEEFATVQDVVDYLSARAQ